MRNFHRGYKNDSSSGFNRGRTDRDNRYHQQESSKRPTDKGFNRSFSDRNTKLRRDYDAEHPSRSSYGQDDRDRNVGNRSFGGNNRSFQERNFRNTKPERSSFRNHTPPRPRDRDFDTRFNRSIETRRSSPPFRSRNEFSAPLIRPRPARGVPHRGPTNFGSSGSRILRKNDLRGSLISKRAVPINRSKEYIKKIKQARLKWFSNESGCRDSVKVDESVTPPKESKKAEQSFRVREEHDEDFLDVANDVTFDEDEMTGKNESKNEKNGKPSEAQDCEEVAKKSSAEDLNNSGTSKSEERSRADRSEKSASKEKDRTSPIDLSCVHCSTKCSTIQDFRYHLTRRTHLMAMKKVSIRVRSTLNRLRKIQRERQLEIEARLKNVEKIPSKYCQICKLYFRQSKIEHRDSEDHKKMVAYLKPYCKICHIQLLSAMKFEIHKCTLNHLKAKSRTNEPADDVDFDELNLGDFKTVDSIGDVDGEEGKPTHISQSSITQKMIFDNPVESDMDDDKFGSVDEASPIGQEYVNKVEVNYCSLCREYLLRTSKDEKIISDHCKSKKHLKWFYQSKKKDEIDRCAKLKENESELVASKEVLSKTSTSQENDKNSKRGESSTSKAVASQEKDKKTENDSSQKEDPMKEANVDTEFDTTGEGTKKFKRYFENDQ